MADLVTVCITTYNRSNLLPLTIESVQKQTYKDIEIIIVDDASTDDTEEVVSKLLQTDMRIRYIKHDINKGLAAARNTAIFNAKGKYFTFCDDDDIWKENFVEEFVKLAEKFNEKFCFCCGNIYLDKNKNEIGIIPKFSGKLREIIKKGYTPPVAAQFYYTQTIQNLGGYNTEIKTGVDHDLWILLALNDVQIISLPLALSYPNFSAKDIKMTHNYKMRISGIGDSLLTWKEKLISMYGPNFYEKFYNAYLEREYQKFFLSFVRDKRYLKALKTLPKINFYKLFIRIIKKAKNNHNSLPDSKHIMNPVLNLNID